MRTQKTLRIGCAALLMFLSLCAQSAAPGTLDIAAERYRPELAAAVEQCLTGAQTMRERIVAKDLEGAKKAGVEWKSGGCDQTFKTQHWKLDGHRFVATSPKHFGIATKLCKCPAGHK